jgi:hypothetical protein
MQTDTTTLTCLTNDNGFTCTTPAIFSGGDMFISLLLLIFLVITIISLTIESIFYVKIYKEYQIWSSDIEGKQNIKI